MLGRKKLKTLTWCVTSLFVFQSCTESPTNTSKQVDNIQRFQGETQGTTYGIQIVKGPEIFKKDIDSILHDFDMSLSGYVSESVVSKFNSSPKGIYPIPENDAYFINCFYLAEGIFNRTDGAFDPTVLPLMKLWGFLKTTEYIPTQSQIDSTLSFVGFESKKHYLDLAGCDDLAFRIKKNDSRFQLDFNAIAQGYSVDVVADYLKSKGCENLYVEIGGEIYVEGKNPEGNSWRLGVDKPVAGNEGTKQRVVSAVIGLEKGGIATSGNYRKFYEKDGKIYAHTINPKTGHPAENEILSATVIAKSTAIADGMATAFMVMGLEKTKEFLKTKNTDSLEVLIIYSGQKNELKSWTTEEMEKRLL